jgi:hypothetical protein
MTDQEFSCVNAACRSLGEHHPLCQYKPAPAKVAQGEAIHQWEFADAWMDTDESGAASARCEGYKTRIVYTAPPSPDAELVTLLVDAKSALDPFDDKLLEARIDAKLASL